MSDYLDGKKTTPRSARAIAERIAEIKRVWEPGMSAIDVSRAVRFECTRNAIIGIFSRHKAELMPCHLNSRMKGQRKGSYAPRSQAKREVAINENTGVITKVRNAAATAANDPTVFSTDLRGANNTVGVRNVQIRTKMRADGIMAPYYNPRATLPNLDDRSIVHESYERFEGRILDLVDLTSQTCKWPFGDENFTFCGQKIEHGPYCTHHAKLAYRETPVHVEIPRRRVLTKQGRD